MTPRRKAARIFRDWCAANGLAVDPIAAADLVNRIAAALSPQEARKPMADYTAWLIEIPEGGSVAEGGPVYFQMVNDDDWTPDHDKALHFGRKQDAEAVIAYYGWNRTKATEHCWPEPAEREVIAESNGHHWIKAFNLTCCRDCGIVRRADDQNNPCKGIVYVGLRDAVGGGKQS